MTLDLDAIAREVGLIELRDVWADLPADYTQALSRFAALLLEKVADEAEDTGIMGLLSEDDVIVSKWLRSMAAGMGE